MLSDNKMVFFTDCCITHIIIKNKLMIRLSKLSNCLPLRNNNTFLYFPYRYSFIILAWLDPPLIPLLSSTLLLSSQFLSTYCININPRKLTFITTYCFRLGRRYMKRLTIFSFHWKIHPFHKKITYED